jgi:hypothetical protein
VRSKYFWAFIRRGSSDILGSVSAEEKRERRREVVRQFDASHPGRRLEYQRKWARENPDNVRASRRASKKKRRALDPDKFREESRRNHAAHKQQEREQGRRYRAANRETRTQKSRKYKTAHPEKRLENLRKWQAAHPQEVREYARKWRKSHPADPEKERVRRKKWQLANPEKYHEASVRGCRKYRATHHHSQTITNAIRRAREKNAPGKHTAADLAALWDKQAGLCASCQIPLHKTGKGKRHLDHIVPLKPRKGGLAGTNWPNNLQWLCPRCNQSKGNLQPEEWAKKRAMNPRLCQCPS